MSYRLFLFLLMLGIMALGRTEACSCTRDSGMEHQFRAAKHVFIVRIESVKRVDVSPHSGDEPQLATYTVVENFRGDPRLVPSLRSGYGGGDCGTPLIVGLDYLVLVGDDGSVNFCSGFYGPHFGWNSDWHVMDGKKDALATFTDSVRNYFRSGTPITPPPPPEFVGEDSYMSPPPPPPAPSGKGKSRRSSHCPGR